MFEPNDIEVQCWPVQPVGGMQTGKIPNGIKITHKKSGVTVTCEQHRNQYKNKTEAIGLLAQKLKELEAKNSTEK